MSSTEDISKNQIWFGIFLVVLLTAGYILADRVLVKLNKHDQVSNTEISDKIDNIEKILSPYEKKDSMNRLVVVDNFSNSVVNYEPTNNFEKQLVTKGNFASGYLYVKASSNSKSLADDETVYIKLTGKKNDKYTEVGGHLISYKSLEVPKSSERTELLYDLSDVKYKISFRDSDFEVISGNWLDLLNGGDQKVLGFLSTIKSGVIHEIVFYYDCATNSYCNISVR